MRACALTTTIIFFFFGLFAHSFLWHFTPDREEPACPLWVRQDPMNCVSLPACRVWPSSPPSPSFLPSHSPLSSYVHLSPCVNMLLWFQFVQYFDFLYIFFKGGGSGGCGIDNRYMDCPMLCIVYLSIITNIVDVKLASDWVLGD